MTSDAVAKQIITQVFTHKVNSATYIGMSDEDRLVKLIATQVAEARRDGYNQGYDDATAKKERAITPDSN